MHEEYLDVLKNSPLFEGLTAQDFAKLLSSFHEVDMKEGQILFRQGDKSDAMYIVLFGHLVAILENQDGNSELIGRVKAGEVVGEMGFLSDKPRSLTVKSFTESKLLKVSKSEFAKFTQLLPKAVYAILINNIARNQEAIHKLEKRHNDTQPRCIFVMPANVQVGFTEFIRLLKTQNRNYIVHLCNTAKMQQIYLHDGLAQVLDYLDHLIDENQTVVYFAETAYPELNYIILKHATTLVIVGNGEEKPRYSPFVLSLLNNPKLMNNSNLPINKQLVLLWSSRATIKNTNVWLEQNYYQIHHHLKREDLDYQRVLRFWAGKSIGLVLGGGASRSWVHVGVLNALNANNIPIDFVAGVSAGAAVAAFYLTTYSRQEIFDRVMAMSRAIQEAVSWQALTVPVVSIYDCVTPTQTLRGIFNEQLIEDLPIPYFAVSCNITTNKEVLNNKGLLWEAVRSSASIPGIFPPFVANGELLVDGGLMNNLPVDRMRQIFGNKSVIIACDLGAVDEEYKKCYFPPMLAAKDVVLSLFKREHNYPPFFNTIIKSMLIGSAEKYQHNIMLADYCIRPNLVGFGLFDFDAIAQRKLIRLGYESAKGTLPIWDVERCVL